MHLGHLHGLLNHRYLPCVEPINQDVQSIWEDAGGNPRRIRQAVFEFQRQRSQQGASSRRLQKGTSLNGSLSHKTRQKSGRIRLKTVRNGTYFCFQR